MEDNRELFEDRPVPGAVRALALPAVLSQLITVIYNMADTFFVGQIGDPDQVAAASMCLPLFVMMTGMANLFGIGGAGLVSRSMGAGKPERARSAAAFSIWSAVAVSLIYGAAVIILGSFFLRLIGSNEATDSFCRDYLFWTIGIGSIPTVVSAVLAHLLRAEGLGKEASFGLTMGGVLNIILDPVFILVLGLEIRGAAMATMISNAAALIYFIALFVRKRSSLTVSLSPEYYSWGHGIASGIILTGLPSSVMNLMGVISNITMNRLMVSYSNEAVAGIGIAKRVDLLAFAIATGMSQGVLPLIAYNYASGNRGRMMEVFRYTLKLSLTIAFIGMIVLLTMAGPLVRAFIDDPLTVSYGIRFQRIICITGPCISVLMIIITFFQAVGDRVSPLLLSFLRKGGLDIPLMFMLERFVGVDGIAWATPAAEVLAMTAALFVFSSYLKRHPETGAAG